MTSRGTVLHAFRLAIRLIPDDVRAQIPAGRLKRKGQPPGDADEVFGLEAIGRCRPHVHGTHGVLLVWRAPRPPARCVRVADVEPQRAVLPEDAPYLFKCLYKG